MPKQERASLTVIDVGRRAGVSGRTVSRVINDDPAVRGETRERVLAAIGELGFTPNLAARSLRSARSFNIVLFTRQYSSFYFSAAVHGAAKGCAEHGYNLVIQEVLPMGAVRWDETLAKLPMHGAILLPPLSDEAELLDALCLRHIPHVCIAPASHRDGAHNISADEAAGIAALAEHLWALGHRQFGYIDGPAQLASSGARRADFIGALQKLGAQSDDICTFAMSAILENGHDERGASITNATAGTEAIDAIHAMDDPPTAIFAFSDEVAIGAMARAHELGMRMPQDLAIAGFDNADIGVMFRPQLSTVDQPIMEMVGAAVSHLAGAEAVSSIFPVRFLARGSTSEEPIRDTAFPIATLTP